MKETVLNKLNVNHPLKMDYQIAFLKHIIQQLEKHNVEEVHDIIYEQLAMKLKEPKPEFSYKHFLIDDNKAITIKESNSFIRDGTTGLKLWPAAIALSEFILQNKNFFNDKSVLELGCGATGFVGMVLLRCCQPLKVLNSDCHDSVLKNLIENVNLNLADDDCVEEMEKSLLYSQRLRLRQNVEFAVLNLPWEDVAKHQGELQSSKLNVILAADVIYDDSIFDALITCISKLFELSNSSLTFILSQTVRNTETFEKFTNLLHTNNFETADLTLHQPTTLNWDSSSQIKILRISKRWMLRW